MTGQLLQRWLEYYDPIHRGWTPRGIANGVCATNGYFYPRIYGGYNLSRAVGGVPDASAEIVGAAGFDASTIATFPWIGHEPETTYSYRLTALNGGGRENLSHVETADAVFDDGGIWLGALPNAPGDLGVRPAAGGRFLVTWTYNHEGEAAPPVHFNLYHDGGTGTVDYDTVVATVTYRRGQYHFAYTSNPFANNTRVTWAVRAVAIPFIAEGNVRTAFAYADAAAPPINPTVVIECVDQSEDEL